MFRNLKKAWNCFKPSTLVVTPSLHSTTNATPVENSKPTVYICHTGDEKQTMAIPLRHKLGREGYSPFVDDLDIPRGADSIQTMYDKMENADIFAIILSRKFFISEWPVKEMMFALERRKRCTEEGRYPPTVIPVFYSISPREMENDITSMYIALRENWSYNDAMPEEEEYREAVMAIRRCMGVMNHFDADNGSHTSSKKKREALLTDVCKYMSRVCRKPEGDEDSHNEQPSQGSQDLDSS